MRNAALSILIAVIPAAAWADARDKVDMLLRDYDSISRNLQTTQLAQSALMKQKAIIEAQGSDLLKRQDALNAHPRDPNAAWANPQKPQDENKSRCGSQSGTDGKDTPLPAGDCDNKTRKLGKIGIAVNAGTLPLENSQSRLDLDYNRYREAANDWNAQEQQTMATLNRMYRSMNDWADRAERLITSSPFQQEVLAEHWEKYCPNRAMPSGLLSIDQVVRFADGYANCLKYIVPRRKLDTAP